MKTPRVILPKFSDEDRMNKEFKPQELDGYRVRYGYKKGWSYVKNAVNKTETPSTITSNEVKPVTEPKINNVEYHKRLEDKMDEIIKKFTPNEKQESTTVEQPIIQKESLPATVHDVSDVEENIEPLQVIEPPTIQRRYKSNSLFRQ